MMGYQSCGLPGLATGWGLLVAIALFLGALFGRVFALAAQDRVIRLEERLRLRELLPAELRGRVNDFTAAQLIAMRFASDGELAELAAAVLRDNVVQRAAIKKMIEAVAGRRVARLRPERPQRGGARAVAVAESK